jgi:hypothetical protein
MIWVIANFYVRLQSLMSSSLALLPYPSWLMRSAERTGTAPWLPSGVEYAFSVSLSTLRLWWDIFQPLCLPMSGGMSFLLWAYLRYSFQSFSGDGEPVAILDFIKEWLPIIGTVLIGGYIAIRDFILRDNKDKRDAKKLPAEESQLKADAAESFQQAIDLAYERLSVDYKRIEAKLTVTETALAAETEARKAVAASLAVVKEDLAQSQGMLKKETEKRVNVENEVVIIKHGDERKTKQMARLMWGIGQIIEQLKANHITPVYDPNTDPELK